MMPRLLIGVGLLLLAAAGGWQLNAALWMSHYHRVGSALVRQEQARLDAAQSPSLSSLAACKSTTKANGPQGLLEFPELSVVAPVEQGESDATLSVAVGHDTSSVWPGTNGTSVLTSHDVTYFVNINHLKTGQAVSYLTPCITYTYKVTSQKVVTAGTAIYNTPGPSIALVTCWPTNALFYTNDRLVVFLAQTKAVEVVKANVIGGSSNGVLTADARQPSVNVPAALARQGLTLAQDSIPMGVLTILGNANPRYVQSPAPLLAQDAAIVAWLGGTKALAQGHVDWWKQFAPKVAPPAQLVGHSVTGYVSQVNVYIEAHGFAVTGVSVQATVDVDGGVHKMNMGTSINSHNVMTITSWTVS